ncbi:MAG: exonuclease SbcCD subunit D [Candidatus Binatia bacterium]
MKFLHTADWQIGMKAAHVGAVGQRVRDERLAAARRVVQATNAANAEFILMAGDTFEDNGVDRVLIQKVADILAEFSGPVYVIPGNHDPMVPGSVWEHPAWKSHGQVQVLKQAEPVEITGGVLYPCPVREKRSTRNPTAWINTTGAQGVRIGLAHGTVDSVHQEEPDYPIPRDTALRTGLDYLALGHWHSTTVYPDQSGFVRMAYSGTHEPTKFGERDSGNVLLVEIPETGAPPVVTSVRTGDLHWAVIEENLREPGDLVRVRERIEVLENPAKTLLELRLKGLLSAQERDELLRLQELLTARFLCGRVNVALLRPSPQDELWLAGLPAGAIREAASRLLALADPGYVGQRPEGASAEVAARALLELYVLMTEVGA